MGIDKDKKLSAAAELRRHAEERLRAKTAESAIHPGPRKMRSGSFMNLQVHQIELEMQNAELRRAQEELELSRNKYEELMTLHPSAILPLMHTD